MWIWWGNAANLWPGHEQWKLSSMRRLFCDCRGRKPGVSADKKNSSGREMGLGVGPTGRGQRAAVQQDSQSWHGEFQRPEHPRAIWLQGLQSICCSITPFYTQGNWDPVKWISDAFRPTWAREALSLGPGFCKQCSQTIYCKGPFGF